jgi:hypothetical protein
MTIKINLYNFSTDSGSSGARRFPIRRTSWLQHFESSRKSSLGSSDDSVCEPRNMEFFRDLGRNIKNDEIYHMIFQTCKSDHDTLDSHRFVKVLLRLGLSLSDPRLRDVQKNLEICQNQKIENVDIIEDANFFSIDFYCFKGIIGRILKVI